MSDNEDLTLSSPTQSSTRLMNQGHANSNDKPLVFNIKPQIPSVKNFLLGLNNFFTKLKSKKHNMILTPDDSKKFFHYFKIFFVLLSKFRIKN
jgi:hypothetical protein